MWLGGEMVKWNNDDLQNYHDCCGLISDLSTRRYISRSNHVKTSPIPKEMKTITPQYSEDEEHETTDYAST